MISAFCVYFLIHPHIFILINDYGTDMKAGCGPTADIISQHGALDETVNFLEKPFSPKALTRKVRDILDQDYQ